ncbi:MAG: SRPBCC domain-containing protein [Candidatus Peribacteria bacterium]|nr:MAG: SRPBCC domain-containing protein [Candidatus Peribacteria bacterium]
MTQITISTKIYAPLQTVRDAWTDPDAITQRNYASDDRHCPSATVDFRIGGTYSARMEAKDGSFGFDFVTIYDDIVDQQKIVSTMEDGRKIHTTFVEDGSCGCVTITTTFDAEDQNDIDMQRS